MGATRRCPDAGAAGTPSAGPLPQQANPTEAFALALPSSRISVPYMTWQGGSSCCLVRSWLEWHLLLETFPDYLSPYLLCILSVYHLVVDFAHLLVDLAVLCPPRRKQASCSSQSPLYPQGQAHSRCSVDEGRPESVQPCNVKNRRVFVG